MYTYNSIENQKKILFFFLFNFSIFLSAQTIEYREMALDHPVCIYKEDLKKYSPSQLSRPLKQLNLPKFKSSTFIVTYNGFSQEARDAFQYAVDIWERIIVSSVPIRVDATFTALEGSTLGSAGAATLITTSFNENIDENTWYPAALYEKLLGQDREGRTGRSNDITARFNSNFDWYYGTDGNTPSNQSDFVSVVLHELAHGLGFAGFARVEGVNGEIRSQNRALGYDGFIINGNDVSILDFEDPSRALLGQFVSDNLFNSSPSAIAQNNNIIPKIYAPSTFNRGSSYSHWDEDTYNFGDINSLMTPRIARGEAIHDPGPITLGLFKDMGWTISSSVLSTENITNNVDFKVWPNPFNDQILLSLNDLNLDKIEIKLHDLKGSVLFHKKYDVQNENILINNMESLGNGIYFITIKDLESNFRTTKKVIKS